MDTEVGQTLRLEGFAESLKGHRIYCVAKSPKFAEIFVRGRVAALDADVAHRGRKVLAVQGGVGIPRWLLSIGWDATFHVRDVADLKLALTHVQHAARPTRVFWFGGEPQAAVMTALARMEGLTLVTIGEKPPVSPDWQAVFWPPDAAVEEVEAGVITRTGSAGTGQLRAVLKELRASNVGLVWSAIGESDRRGGLYWYDPQEGEDLRPGVDVGEAAEMLRKVADMIAERR
jgi:hypothetical protein